MRSAYPVLATVLLGASLQADAGDPAVRPRLRPLGADARALLESAQAQSPTVRQLIDDVERSDLIVYLRISDAVPHYTAETRLMIATPTCRFVLVSLTTSGDAAERTALLGHELRHVAEIAQAPWARDLESLRRLFESIGWHVQGRDHFETLAAVETGRRVMFELTHVVSDNEFVPAL